MSRYLIGKTVEVYINDMVMKTKKPENHLADLKTVFDILRTFRLRLNTSKCTFGVGSRKFLGYLVTRKDIEASPDQIKAILELESPTLAKQVQMLTRKAAALNKFISRILAFGLAAETDPVELVIGLLTSLDLIGQSLTMWPVLPQRKHTSDARKEAPMCFFPQSGQFGVDSLLWPIYCLFENDRPFSKLGPVLFPLHSVVGVVVCFLAAIVASTINALSSTST
ncbi:uncharacterized protein LOC114276369 [Camellia sinensis]|uniref:uncharacterized protein LOC114276369 n=1 Tax=Camellia sinensis TaxID=4442 RepID=UPI001036582C|nr:uncharacterized protein LOC114276369 [Camellia sinensis]